MTFKVGDRVRVVGSNWDSNYSDLAVIIKKAPPGWAIRIVGFPYDDRPGDLDFHPASEDEMELVSESEWGLLNPDKPNLKTKQSSYYDFPGGVEVRQISAHLTGFGAQALQYVARATRLDGKNKGDVVSDLAKAIDFIRWEIERLQGDSK